MPGPRASERAFQGRFLSIDVEHWDGIGLYEVMRHPGASAVLPVTPENDVVLVRQFRPAIRQVTTEVPAGLLDVEGEDALTCAARELNEETGYAPVAIEFLGGVHTSSGSSDEYVHLFWARTGPDPLSAPEPGIEIIREPLERMIDAARSGRVRDAKTALALLLASGRPPLPTTDQGSAPGHVQ